MDMDMVVLGGRDIPRQGEEVRLDRAVLVPEPKFAMDSPLEGDGFEPSVPHLR